MAWERYLKEVLGVSQVVWPVEAPVLRESPPADVKILFLAEPASPSLLEMEIFQKMLIAMKLEPTDFFVWEIATIDLAVKEKEIGPDTVVVSFSKKISEFLSQQRSKLEQITTPHPSEVEKNPKLKRQVWEDLKTALEKSGLSTRLQS